MRPYADDHALPMKSPSSTFQQMKTIKARVQNGKIVGDAPAELPEGSQVELRIVDPHEDLSDDELAELNTLLDAAWESVRAGRTIPAEEFLAELASKGK